MTTIEQRRESPLRTERPSRRESRPGRGHGMGALLLATPATGLVMLFVLLPAALVLALTFFRYDALSGDLSPAGLDNYRSLLADGELAAITGHTLLYTLLTVPTTVALGLLVALGIHRVTHAAVFWRTVYFLPVASTLAAMSVVWQWLYHPETGLVDRLLEPVLGVHAWLESTTLAMPALAVIGNWYGIGTVVILYLAALTAVPHDVHEAAAMDGARAWNRFWHVTWPAVGPATVFTVVLTTRNSLAMFDQVRVMTKGGPVDSTNTLAYELYRRGFLYFDAGGAAVVTLVLLLLLLAATCLQMLTYGRRLNEAGAR